jgi:hypothetical protein
MEIIAMGLANTIANWYKTLGIYRLDRHQIQVYQRRRLRRLLR